MPKRKYSGVALGATLMLYQGAGVPAITTSAAAQSDMGSGAIDPSVQIEPSSTSSANNDAWWTGPIFASNAATLPKGHFLIEPYLYDSISFFYYDDAWIHHSVARDNAVRSLTYFMYGVSDSLTVGIFPMFGFNKDSGSPRSQVRPGDTTLRLQYAIAHFQDSSTMPDASIVLDETFPTGRYDNLNGQPSGGGGTGAYETTASLYSQYIFHSWNGHAVRARLNFAYAFANHRVDLTGVSVYETDPRFRGYAEPGGQLSADLAFEYSHTQHWVVALDIVLAHGESTRVIENMASQFRSDVSSVEERSGTSDSLMIAPAVEYNWSSSVGVIAGIAGTVAGRNTLGVVAPVVGVNAYF